MNISKTHINFALFTQQLLMVGNIENWHRKCQTRLFQLVGRT